MNYCPAENVALLIYSHTRQCLSNLFSRIIYFVSFEKNFVFELMDPAIPVDQMETVDLETDTEQLERQLEDLTKQLHESITLEISSLFSKDSSQVD